MDQQAHVLILRRVASAAVDDARAAWRKTIGPPNEQRVRAAYRACVFAARALHQYATAPGVPKAEAGQVLAQADRLKATAEQLKAKLVRLAEG